MNQRPSRARRRRLRSTSTPQAAWQTVAAIGMAAGAACIAVPERALAQTSAGSRQAVHYAIAAGTLDQVLNRFATASGLELSVDAALTRGKSSPGLQGVFTVTEGFDRLLAGHDLLAERGPQGLYTLRAAPKAPAAAAPAGAVPPLPQPMTTLAPVVVTGSAPRLYETPDVNAGALGMRETQDVPFSIGSYTVDTVQNQRARTALDVLKNDPSVSPVTYGASFDGVAVRGFSANTFNNVRRDGLLANVYADVPLENKDRIDVLKGVSGFLYGVGDPSGLVNYVTKRPTREALLSLTGEVRTQRGGYVSIDAGGPLGEGQFGYRFNAAKEKVGNFTHPGDLDREFVSGALDAKLSRDLMLQLDFDYQEKAQSANANLGPRSDGTLVPANSIDPRVLIGQSWGRYRSRSWNLGSRLDYALNSDWTLTGQFGYGVTKRNALFNNVNTIALNGDVVDGNISYEGEDYRVASGQFFATGRFETGSLKHELVSGYSYSRMTYPEGPYTRLADTIGNIYRPNVVADPGLPADTDLPEAKSVQHSIFLSDTVALSERWSVLLGARYIDYLNDKPRDYPDSGVHLRYTTGSTVPTASVMFKPAKHTTVYATFTKGFEQGAYAPGWADNAYQRLEPITSTQYEFGIKSNIRPGLMLTSALFDIEKPLQAVSALDNLFKTQGRQRHRGIEFAANGELAPRLSGILGLAWLQARQHDTGDANVDGKRPANVARLQASVFLDYRLESVPGLAVNAGYYRMGNRPLDGANTVMVDAFNRWDLGASYTTGILNRPTVLRLAVQNVADKRYWESVVYGTVGMAQPRTVRLSLTTNF